MALLVHGYYIVGVTNFGDFISDLTAPMCVVDPSCSSIFETDAVLITYGP